ncbi:MAG: RCC1 repeat-containing protein, partial [Actinomycetota bacterium]
MAPPPSDRRPTWIATLPRTSALGSTPSRRTERSILAAPRLSETAAFCWGGNFQGQLGDLTNTSSDVPVAVQGSHTFAAIDAGGGHTCGVTTAEEAFCWGSNDFGQLGDGNPMSSDVPVAVQGVH